MDCSEICKLPYDCDEISGVCSDVSLICTGGHDALCQDNCRGYLSTRPPTSSTSSTVGGSAEPVYGNKETPQYEVCSPVAFYLVLFLALLLLVVVVFLVVKNYGKDIKDIFKQCKGLFLTRHSSGSSREEDAEAQPLIDHWTEIVRCWRELTKLLDRTEPSQTEGEEVDCTCAHLAEDFKRWAGLFGIKHGDTVRYTRDNETGEDMPGGSSEQTQSTATTTTDRHDKDVKPISDKQADPSEIPPAQQPSEPPQPPAHGAREHSGKIVVAGKGTKDSSAKLNKAEGNDPKNKTLQPNLATPQSSPRRRSAGKAADRESSRNQVQTPKARETIPHGTGASSNTVGGTLTTNYVTTHSNVKQGQPPHSPVKKVTPSSNSRQQDSGAQRAEGYQQQSSSDPKTISAASPEKQGAHPSVGSGGAHGAQTPATRASQAPGSQTTGPVQCTNEGNANRAANIYRDEENEEEELNLLSDNSGGAAVSAPMGAEPKCPSRSPTDYPRPSEATREEAFANSGASTGNFDFRSGNSTPSNPEPSGQPGGRPQPDSVNSGSHWPEYWPPSNAQQPVPQDGPPGIQLSLPCVSFANPKSY